MDNYQVYKDIRTRTGGEIYLGVLGPVRTGKSTFIKRFMNLCVIPQMNDTHQRERAIDELPLSGEGTMITTMEPKFIPKEATTISLAEDVQVKVRLIDSVGYLIDGAAGHIDNDRERMVKTPWQEEPVSFRKAAEMGTKKVMEHSTIGIIVTTDGSIGTMERAAYEEAEKKTVAEMKMTGKPFVVLLNSKQPVSPSTIELAGQLKREYGVSVLPINCEQLRMEDIAKILSEVLYSFPVSEIRFFYPEWISILPPEHAIRKSILENAREIVNRIGLIRDVPDSLEQKETDGGGTVFIRQIKPMRIHMETGIVEIRIELYPELYYQALSELSGMEIHNEYQFVKLLKELVEKRNIYEKVERAMNEVDQFGYSIVTPDREEIELDAPEVIRHGNKFGVKLHASAPSINLIKAGIVTEIAPIVGSEQQAEDLIRYIEEQGKNNPEGIWDTNIFGKTILELVEDGIHTKVERLTQESRMKLQTSMEKIMNESRGGIICIII